MLFCSSTLSLAPGHICWVKCSGWLLLLPSLGQSGSPCTMYGLLGTDIIIIIRIAWFPLQKWTCLLDDKTQVELNFPPQIEFPPQRILTSCGSVDRSLLHPLNRVIIITENRNPGKKSSADSIHQIRNKFCRYFRSHVYPLCTARTKNKQLRWSGRSLLLHHNIYSLLAISAWEVSFTYFVAKN